MAAYKKLAELAYRLHQRTVEGKIHWEVTVTDGVFQASFSDYSITISVHESEIADGARDVRIRVLADDGNEIESFTDIDIENEWLTEFSVSTDAFDMMYETYEVARRSALGTEQAINDILSELDDEFPF